MAPSSYPSPTTLPSSSPTLATLASLLLLDHGRHALASGPLHLLLSPTQLFTLTCSLPAFQSILKNYQLSRNFPSQSFSFPQLQASLTPTVTIPLSLSLQFFLVSVTTWHLLSNTVLHLNGLYMGTVIFAHPFLFVHLTSPSSRKMSNANK